MPQIMAEAFARGLLDKIMVEVLDVIDRDAEDGKSWEQHVDQETDDAQSGFANDRSQAHEHTRINYSKVEEIELIAKIVRDLRDIQIGDSRYVLPPSLLALEKQVKCAACNVDGVSLASPTVDVAETQHTIQGQGDVHQITQAAILESPTDPTGPTTRMKKTEEEAASEATSVSVGVLHQLIEELDNKTVSVSSEDDATSDSTSKERMAVWEEKEERFIRTIEGNVGNAHEITTEAPRGSESTGRFRVVELKRDEELKSHSSQHMASTLREVDPEAVRIEKRGSNSLSSLKLPCDHVATIMEQILPVDNAEKRKTSLGDATTKKKKRGFGGRLRRFLRVAFGRRKN